VTKARTRAAKRELKRGRPRLPPAIREPNGRPSRRRESVEGDIKSVVVTYRKRQALADGELLTAKQAEDPMRGSVLGLICLDGAISKEEYEAGRDYAECKWRYYRLTGIPFPTAQAQNLFAIRGFDGEITPERARRAREAANAYMRCEHVLGSIPGFPPHAIRRAVDAVCFLDQETARLWPEHMLKMLQRGLRELIFAKNLRQT